MFPSIYYSNRVDKGIEDEIKPQIQALVDCETEVWNRKNVDSLLSIIHPDMVWPWPPRSDAHDPMEWVFELGRFDQERWHKNWHSLFEDYDLIHNNRKTVKIEVINEGDGAFADVDIDTRWCHKVTGENFP